MNKQPFTAAWGQLLADIIAGGQPFQRRNVGNRMKTTMFAQSCGEGYTPDDSVRITGAGLKYIQGLYSNSSRLGCSPSERRQNSFSEKG